MTDQIDEALAALKKIDDTHLDDIPPHVEVGEKCWDEVRTIRQTLERQRAPLAGEHDRRNGWTYDPKYLNRIAKTAETIDPDCSPVCMETVEATLKALLVVSQESDQ